MKFTRDVIPLLGILALVALVWIILSPALSKTGNARRMQESSKLRTICQGMYPYLKDHGAYPPAEAWHDVLIDGGYLTEADLTSPRGPLGPPASITRSHYVYVEIPPERDFDATTLMVYENPAHYDKDFRTSGTFAVFADCHVDWITLEELDGYLDAQREMPRSDQ